MSFDKSNGGRRSWRAERSQNSRSIGRVMATLGVALLLAIFLWVVLRAPLDRHTRVWLIEPGSYATDLIAPMMFAATARADLIAAMNAERIDGSAPKIQRWLRDDRSLAESLDDRDDTLIMIVRGYLMLDADGDPSLACSDLDARAGATDLITGDIGSPTIDGLLSLNELWEPLVSRVPESFVGQRLVVIDAEPLASCPRLGQSADEVFESLHRQIANLTGPAAQRLWVLVTRGPLQNVGWDEAAKLPISTQTLLRTFNTSADQNGDYELRLDEWCRVMDARYQQLSRRGSAQPPRLMLLRGGVGVVTDLDDAGEVWVSTPVTEVAPEQTTDGEPDEEPANEPEQSSDEATETPMAPAPVAGEGLERAGQRESDPLTNNIWQTITDVEQMTTGDWLPPIAVAPHLFRKLIGRVTHAEIESLDLLAPVSRRQFADDVSADLRTLMSVAQSLTGASPDGNAPPSNYRSEIVARIELIWRNANAGRTPRTVDDRVRAADELQTWIAIGQLRWWQTTQARRQAILGGDPVIGDQTELTRSLADAESLLIEQAALFGSPDVSPLQPVDEQAMRAMTRSLRDAVTGVDQLIDRSIATLLDDFDRVDETTVWPLHCRAWSWVRSPCGRAFDRDRLAKRVASLPLASWDAATVMEVAEPIKLASVLPDSPSVSLVRRIDSAETEWRTGSATLASSAGISVATTNFADQLRATARIDPHQVDVALASPIVHPIPAAPRQRQSTVRLSESERAIGQFDHNGWRVAAPIMLGGLDPVTLTLDITPDADVELTLDITARATVADDGSPPLRVDWQAIPGGERTFEPGTTRVRVPAGQSLSANLVVQAMTFTESKTISNVELLVRAVGSTNERGSSPNGFAIALGGSSPSGPLDAVTRSFLDRLGDPWLVPVELPRRDSIRLIARTEGLSRPVLSGGGRLPDGLFLRTFASRPTTFSLSLKTDAARPRRVQAWLIQLPDAFAPEGIAAYSADRFVEKAGRLKDNLLGVSGKVSTRILEGPLRLQGPATLVLPPGNPTPLIWTSQNAAKEAAEAPATSETVKTETTAASINVTHGMAVVLRSMDERGVPLPVADEVLWLVPKPWSPESYVDVRSEDVRFERGEVRVTASLKANIDGDDQPDSIPRLAARPVDVRWTHDEQWESFRADSTTPPMNQRIRLTAAAIGNSSAGGRIEVVVAPTRQPCVVQLDVDDWPRAMRRLVDRRDGSGGTQPTRWQSVAFGSVAIEYESSENSRDANAPPPVDQTLFFPRRDAVFRGGARQLTTTLHADFSAGAATDSFPMIRLSEEGRVRQQFASDRSMVTLADAINEDGSLTLTTEVTDLRMNWETEASRADDTLRILATLQTSEAGSGLTPADPASLSVLLDSTPPEIRRLRPSLGPHEVGRPIRWSIDVEDVARNGVRSGIAKIVIAPLATPDAQLDAGGPTETFDPPDPNPNVPERMRTFVPEAAGTFTLAAQAFDAAGLPSEVVRQSVQVREAPKPSPPPPPQMPNVPAQEAPTVTPPPPPVAAPVLGKVSGVIDTRSTLRGTLTISPAPDKIRPSDRIELGGSRPSFAFSNLPPGDYELHFLGSVNGKSIEYRWKGLSLDRPGQQRALATRGAEVEPDKKP